ncbi:hypothetical protein E2P81_ATG04421 [Venturia nashicola]|uniref:Uncharacterized protein n=1 Tax=Venturia nashicola TaxID=86259 RepID=A0A4Z1PNL8_9PEZI|nr:hypothetical protein E6O75_ATG04525 [Venturia nashicola]TLD37609.1 hypothetical protein E2P81_ATG04421 [Venturia nashicola]
MSIHSVDGSVLGVSMRRARQYHELGTVGDLEITENNACTTVAGRLGPCGSVLVVATEYCTVHWVLKAACECSVKFQW